MNGSRTGTRRSIHGVPGGPRCTQRGTIAISIVDWGRVMSRLFCRRELGAAEALLSAAILGVALFAWGTQTDMFDRPGLASTSNWTWRLWQLGALLMGIPGVWWIWRGTRRVAWTRSLTLSVPGPGRVSQRLYRLPVRGACRRRLESSQPRYFWAAAP